MPGAAAYAETASNIAMATIAARSSCVLTIAFFMFVALMAALLINVDFGHQAAEVLCVVGKVIKIRGVKVIGTLGHSGGVENDVERLTSPQRDRIGGVVEVVSRLI